MKWLVVAVWALVGAEAATIAVMLTDDRITLVMRLAEKEAQLAVALYAAETSARVAEEALAARPPRVLMARCPALPGSD